MWWQFKSAFVRKIGYLLAALVVAMVIGHRAHADQNCFVYVSGGGPGSCPNVTGSWATAEQAGAAEFSACVAAGTFQGQTNQTSNGPVTVTYSLGSCSPSGAPSSSGTAQCDVNSYYSGGNYQPTNPISEIQVGAVSGPCPQNCQSAPNVDILTAIKGNTGAPAGSMCYQGCQYTNSANTLVVGGSKGTLYGQAVSSGVSCAVGDGTNPSLYADCMQGDGVTSCFLPAGGNAVQQASVNGDTVGAPAAPVTAATPSKCSGYADGAAACVQPADGSVNPSAPTNPDGSAAAPAIVVSDGNGRVNYYSATQVANSKTPVGLTSTTPGTGTGLAGNGSGAGVTGDCPAGQTCGGVTDSISGGLDCQTPPACTDTDPVQCGIANQVWLVRCQSVAESDIAQQITAMGGDPGLVPQTVTDLSDVLSESSAGSNWGSVAGGGSTCPAPVTFTLFGNTVTYDIFGHLCDLAGMISWAVMIVAYMVGARVMFTGAVSNSL